MRAPTWRMRRVFHWPNGFEAFETRQQTRQITANLPPDLVKTLGGGRVLHEIVAQVFDRSFYRGECISLATMIVFGFAQARLGFRVFGALVLLFFFKAFKFDGEQFKALFRRSDLGAQNFAAVIETDDLIGFVEMFALGAVALESVVCVNLTNLRKVLFGGSGRLRRFANCFFLRCDLLVKIGLDGLGLAKLFL